ncbi:MAG: hypothetical protein JO310_18290 [Hyphomicrobiales bacterium]|nr:hypothetical protein [Hyphomicrobiales bacterium]
MAKTKILGIRVEPALKADLELAADADRRTVSGLILKLVRDYLDGLPAQKRSRRAGSNQKEAA